MAARTCPGDRLLSLPARSRRAGRLGGWQGRRAATQHSTQRPAGGRRPRPNKDKSASVSLPSPSQMRVVESGVSVTAMPSANQAARVNVRVPTQMSPFCQPLSVMASRSGPCGRQWGGRCGESVLGRLSPTLGESTCHVTPGRAIAISTTAATRVRMVPNTEAMGCWALCRLRRQ